MNSVVHRSDDLLLFFYVTLGALEMVQLQVDCKFVKDVLRGDDSTELRVEFKGLVKNVMSDEYREN